MGAGAMIPFGGPTTQELTDRLLKNNICEKLFNPIWSRISQNGNFEFLLSSLEILFEWKHTNERDKSNFNQYLLLQPTWAYQFYSASKLWEVYSEAINEIIERVKKYDSYTHPIPNKLDNFAMFLLNLIKTNYLKIYSLNYDRLIPKIMKEKGKIFYEGFDDLRCEYDLAIFNKSPYTFFNLHGSIYNSYISGGDVKISDTPINLEHHYNLQGGNTGEHKVFLPIIAGYSKSQRIMSELSNFGIAAFMNDCNTCDRLIIAGYSFVDPYVNSILKKYVKFRSTEIIIVDYNHGSQLPERLTSIPYWRLGIPQAKFIEKGSIFILDKNPHIKLYVKGFEQYIFDNLNNELSLN